MPRTSWRYAIPQDAALATLQVDCYSHAYRGEDSQAAELVNALELRICEAALRLQPRQGRGTAI
ncbi:hypothetical protein GCM10027033_29650 [Leucobacter ruminantium]